MKKVIAAAALAGAVWFVWPYFTAYSLAKAIDSGDSVKFEQHVSWTSVRQGIKDDLNAVLFQSLAKSQEVDKQNNLFSGLAALFLPAMVKQMVDAYMTPSGLASLLRERSTKLPKTDQTGSPSVQGERKKLKIENVKHAFFTGPMSFLVELGGAKGEDDMRIKVLMRFEDFGWKITRIFLPVDKMANEQSQIDGPLKQFDESLALKGGRVDVTGDALKKKEGVLAKRDEVARATENTTYVEKVNLYAFAARYYKTYLDKSVPGVTFKLKNEGEKTLKRVEVTVYFKDAKGKIIAEQTYLPVNVSKYSFGGDNKPLKPGYIWQLEQGKFYSAKTVPTEWSSGSAVAKITGIELTESE